ncbi:MAG: MerR family transcriptional regulator [Actinomycetales bacterium]|jgi:MerR family transcriptional regulator/heat shock protein HspR|nr:MerR family transcriptional regulator [Actinomycetales bacterium]
MEQLDENSPIFAIGVAAELAMMHPQTLRDYDRMGLVVPERTGGQTRRYTMRNIAQLREIARLSSEGVSLEGIRRILELENQNAALAKRVAELEKALANELMNRPGARVFAAGDTGIVSMAAGRRPTRSTSVVVWRQQ